MVAKNKTANEIDEHIEQLKNAYVTPGCSVLLDHFFWLKEQGFIETWKPHPNDQNDPPKIYLVTISQKGIDELRRRGEIQ